MRLAWMLCTAYILYASQTFAQTCGDLPAYSIMTAQQVYNLAIQESFHLGYRDASNGCYQRAEKIHELMSFNKILDMQAFIQVEYETSACGATGAGCIGANSGDGPKIYFKSIYSSTTSYAWDFHTAPVICVRTGGKEQLYVIDPSTFMKPVPMSRWTQTLSKGLSINEYSVYLRKFY